MAPDAAPSAALASLVVESGGERLALPADVVVEVIRPRPLSRVPHAPAALLGVASLRGAVLPVVSLARLRGGGGEAAGPGARLVVVAGELPLGLMVDGVASLGDAADLPRLDLPALLAARFGAKAGLAVAPRPAGPRPEAPALAAPAAEESTLTVLAFTVDGQAFALPLSEVDEVMVRPGDIAPAAGADPALIGAAALRGALLPLISARALLGRRPDAEGRVLVLRLAGAALGLAIDRVDRILRVPASRVEPVPAVLARGRGEARAEAICRPDEGGRLLTLLSPGRLLDEDTMRRVAASAAATAPAGGEIDAVEARGETESFVIFALGGERYGMPASAVEEVARLPEALTRVPRAAAFVEGVMSLRGTVLPVIDASRRFGAAPAAGRRRVLVVTVDGVRAGLAVDAVSEVAAVGPEALRPAPDLGADEAGTFDRVIARGGEEALMLVVSPRALLARAERDALLALAAPEARPRRRP